jgi:hypothetical protein
MSVVTIDKPESPEQNAKGADVKKPASLLSEQHLKWGWTFI